MRTLVFFLMFVVVAVALRMPPPTPGWKLAKWKPKQIGASTKRIRVKTVPNSNEIDSPKNLGNPSGWRGNSLLISKLKPKSTSTSEPTTTLSPTSIYYQPTCPNTDLGKRIADAESNKEGENLQNPFMAYTKKGNAVVTTKRMKKPKRISPGRCVQIKRKLTIETY